MTKNTVKNMFIGAFCFSAIAAGTYTLKKIISESKYIEINDNIEKDVCNEVPVRKYTKIK